MWPMIQRLSAIGTTRFTSTNMSSISGVIAAQRMPFAAAAIKRRFALSRGSDAS